MESEFTIKCEPAESKQELSSFTDSPSEEVFSNPANIKAETSNYDEGRSFTVDVDYKLDFKLGNNDVSDLGSFGNVKEEQQSFNEKKIKIQKLGKGYKELKVRVERLFRPLFGVTPQSDSSSAESDGPCQDEDTESENEETPFSSRQLAAMKKYNQLILSDLKTKIKKDGNFFVCAVCNFKKTTLETLRAHLFKHRPGNPFKCLKCSRVCNGRKHLLVHMKSHNERRLYACPDCPKTFKYSGNLAGHRQYVHSPREIQCILCPMKFSSKYGLKNHLRVHSKKEDRKIYYCDICEKVFYSLTGLNSHMNVHGKLQKNHGCYFCSFRSHTYSVIVNHMRAHTLEKIHKCKTCGLRFSLASNLSRHKITHAEIGGKFPCTVSDCMKNYKWKTDLQRHMREVHETKAHKYKCEFQGCEFRTGSLVHFRNHARKVHSTENKFNCRFCGKGFDKKEVLVLHRNEKHLERLKFLCKEPGCEKAFATKSRFEKHTLKHRTVSMRTDKSKTKNAYPCYFCPTKFAYNSGYLRHTLGHTNETPYNCSQPGCGKYRWTREEGLVHHMRKVHAIPGPLLTVKTLKCPSCRKMFASKKSLGHHIARDHDGTAKIYKCNYCSLETNYRSYFQKHVKLFHCKKV